MKAEVTYRRVLLTPDAAERLLQKERNRASSPNMVRQICEDILAGRWIENGDTIGIDWDGYTIDGGNRLRAIIESGKAVYVVLAEGLDPISQLVKDTGTKRRFSHWLQMMGRTDCQNRGAIATLLWNYENGRLATRSLFTSRVGISHEALWRYFEEKEKEIDAALAAGRHAHKRLMLSISSLAAAWHILSEIDREDATGFFAEISSDAVPRPRTGPYLLIRYINNRDRRRTLDQQEQLAYLFKAWNMYRTGAIAAEGQVLYWRPGGKAREAFPQPT